MPAQDNKYAPPPLDALIAELQLKNADLVKNSTEQLTFKQVAKARLGKPVTLNIQHKIANALNRCVGEERFKITDLFA